MIQFSIHYQVAMKLYGVQKRTNVDTWTKDILRAFIRLPPVSDVTLGNHEMVKYVCRF